MNKIAQDVSVVIPTYRRGTIVLDAIRHLLELAGGPGEVVVVDQTQDHSPEVLTLFQWLENPWKIPVDIEKSHPDLFHLWNKAFQSLERTKFRRIVLSAPSIPCAMNVGVQEAGGEIVLFLDDDIIPAPDLIMKHGQAYAQHSDAWAVVGQVLQPEDWNRVGCEFQNNDSIQVPAWKGLRKDLNFKFNADSPGWVENVMAGNLSVRRDRFLSVGGFDEKFIPPVSYRFETEFARRLIRAGGKIRFEPLASIKHLRLSTGGTRSKGSHMASGSPIHGVGDYYYALCCGQGFDRFGYMIRRPFREVRTKFHLAHPWFIPIKFFGELRACALAFRLHRGGGKLVMGDASLQCAQRPIFFFSANKQAGNLGDRVINRELVGLMRARGELRILTEGVDSAFLDALHLLPEECCTRRKMFMYLCRARLQTRPVHVMLTPGGSNDRLHFNPSRELRELAFWLSLRMLGVQLHHVGISLSLAVPARDTYERRFRPQRFKNSCAARDNRSVQVLRSWGVKTAAYMPDLAFMMSPLAELKHPDIPDPYIVFSFRFDKHPPFMERLLRATDAIVSWAIDHGIGCLSLNWQVDADRSSCEELARRYDKRIRVFMQSNELSEDELYAHYRHAEFVFSNRLHVLLFAWIHGGLPVAVADDLSACKVTSLFREEGFDRLVLDTADSGWAESMVGKQLRDVQDHRMAWLSRMADRAPVCRSDIQSFFNRNIAVACSKRASDISSGHGSF